MKTNIYFQFLKEGKTSMMLLIALMISSFSFSQFPTLTVISPNGGETYVGGSSIQINWENTGESVDLLMEFTEDGGNNWYYLAFIYAGDTTSSVTTQLTGNPTSIAKVRISYYNNPFVSDESDGFFTITESPLYFNSPGFGSTYYTNYPVYINWYSYSLTNFSIDYSLDFGSTWTNITNGYTGFDFYWTSPEQISDEALIRVSDDSDSSNYGISPVFSIIEAPEATLLTPNGGEVWNYGETKTVSWSGSNLSAYVNIEFSHDGGNSWIVLNYGYSNPDGGSAEISVPQFSTENALVRIIDYNYYYELDRSDAPFTVVVPPVIVYYPYGGEAYYNNSQTYFSWLASADISLLNVELTTDNGQNWQTIAEGIDAAQGYFYWTVFGNPSESCQMRISDASDASKFGLSGVFTILETPVITLTSPTGGEIWNTGTPKTISWQYEQPGASYVFIDYSLDNGQTWNFINYALIDGPQGSIEWMTPEINSDQCRIRILDFNLQFVADTSDSFTILTFPETPICMVSVDSATNHNVVVWEKPVSDLIDQFMVYKETNEANVYEIIGTVNYDDEAVITDTNSNPNIKSYRYKLGFADAAGNIYPAADLHQTIHLTINQGVGNTWNLIWTSYMGFDVASYNIYRKSAGGNYEMISTISASFNSYTDLTAPAGDVYYIVEVISPNGCNPAARSGEYGSSYSNVATNNVLDVNDPDREIAVSAYPNPANEKLFISAGETFQGKVRIAVNDLLGQQIYSQEVENMKKNSVYTVNTADLKEGIYMMKISSEKGSVTRKIIIKH